MTGLVAISSCKTNPGSPANTLQQQTILIHSPLVISSCGSLHTPALLLRSGITVGGNVGKHLRLHPAAGIVGLFEPTAEQVAAGKGAINMYEVRYWLTCSVATSAAELCCMLLHSKVTEQAEHRWQDVLHFAAVVPLWP